jgi:hypothetical protein
MPYQFKLNKQEYNFPMVEEISISTFIKYRECKSDLEKLNMLMDTDLSNLPASCEKELLAVIGLLNGLDKDIQSRLNKPLDVSDIETIHVLNKTIKFDKDLGRLPYWPMTKVKAVIKGMGDDAFNHYENYQSLVAHYLYCKVTGLPYNEYKAEEFSNEVVADLGWQEVLRLGDFFLFMLRDIWMPKANLLEVNRTLKKYRPASKFLTSMEM